MSQLDALLPDDDGCPDSREFRRALLIELRKVLIIQRGVTLRLRTKRGAR
jgi:hypothetical protein